MQTTDKLMEYIQDSPSPYHAAAAAAARLEAAGFTRLEESAPWALSPGNCFLSPPCSPYYLFRRKKSSPPSAS